jgi:hypothetical protein
MRPSPRPAPLLTLVLACSCAPDLGQDAGPNPQDAGAPVCEPANARPPPAPGFEIRLDTRFDTYGWVTPERRAVINAAADAWGRLLADEFEDVPAGTRIQVRDPEAPDEPAVDVTLDDAIDDIVIFVAAAAFDGRGGVTAESFPTGAADTGDATLDARLLERFDGATFQPWTAWISFDVAERWFEDPTLACDDDLPADHFDLYSTALHEIGHVLGFGSAPAFTALVDGGAFTGARARAVHGGPVPLADDEAHFPDDLRVDGERALMDLSDPEGARFAPTELDLAVLEDLGYTRSP